MNTFHKTSLTYTSTYSRVNIADMYEKCSYTCIHHVTHMYSGILAARHWERLRVTSDDTAVVITSHRLLPPDRDNYSVYLQTRHAGVLVLVHVTTCNPRTMIRHLV